VSERPPRSRWTSFVADPGEPRPRVLFEEGNPDHRLRVEHNRSTLLVHLSDEDGEGWTVLAVDRTTRRWAVAQSRRQLDAAQDAFARLYPDG
jgi:endonuclease/exonuclease/phosphatase (EEP) superfamily protein YafD